MGPGQDYPGSNDPTQQYPAAGQSGAGPEAGSAGQGPPAGPPSGAWAYPPPGSWPPPKQGVSGAMVALIVLLVTLLLIAVGALLYFLVLAPTTQEATEATSGDAQETVWETETVAPESDVAGPAPAPAESRPSPPSGANQCSDSGSGTHARSATGTAATSCEFAQTVRNAYVRSGGSGSISAYSPVTGQWYNMTCTGGDVVTCRGGNNAVVYIY